LHAGRGADFGPLRLRQAQLSVGRRALPWEKVRLIEMQNGVIVIELKKRGRIKVPAIRVPNVNIFLQLIDEDIIAHPDLVKKFGHRATEDMQGEVQQTAKVFKETGVAIEINTSGLRKPVSEMYPSLWNLRIYAQAGVPLTFGSDSHQPDHVGCDFDKAFAFAKQAGFKEYVLFKERKVSRTVKL